MAPQIIPLTDDEIKAVSDDPAMVAKAWALKEASDAFREILNSSPTIEALNKEVGFWTELKKVLRENRRLVFANLKSASGTAYQPPPDTGVSEISKSAKSKLEKR